MTNFEKWKQELSVENAAEGLRCEKCPANEHCFDLYDKSCVDSFKEWADKPSE